MPDLTRSAIESAINEYVLHERDRIIMRRIMVDSATHECIAEELDLSPRTVGNAARRWRPIIKRHL